MSKTSIPERSPIGDVVDGAIIGLEDSTQTALFVGSDVPANSILIARGTLIVRYGIRYLGKPHLSIVPGLVAIDYGTFLTGEEAWEFLIKRSNLYPRAEVFGYRNDGHDEMMTVKTLDLAQPFEALVYSNATTTIPTARPSGVISEANTPLPLRVAELLPQYATLEAWRKAVTDHE